MVSTTRATKCRDACSRLIRDQLQPLGLYLNRALTREPFRSTFQRWDHPIDNPQRRIDHRTLSRFSRFKIVLQKLNYFRIFIDVKLPGKQISPISQHICIANIEITRPQLNITIWNPINFSQIIIYKIISIANIHNYSLKKCLICNKTM